MRSSASATPSPATTGIESVIHMRTLHLGPDELLVAVKIGGRGRRLGRATWRGRSTPRRPRPRAAEPVARVIYIEPDIRPTPVA